MLSKIKGRRRGECAVFKEENGKIYILLVKANRTKYWKMAGGGIDYGENPWDAGARESHEEAGVLGKCTKEDFVVEYID